ncbi:glycosyltransferase family 2 protein [Candidatus Dependentiae bacterium]|nr:glycosyltransferase family 2 protein [Candidatus Dependentiae bacterium]
MKKILILLLFVYINLLASQHFVIVVASYNNKDFCEWNLQTIYEQDYDNYEVRYVDDCSTDGTDILVNDIITKRNQWHRTKFIRNEKRYGSHVRNQYYQIHDCKDDDVIVIVDGDDGLAHPGVLKYLDNIYSNPNIWMTYGQFIEKNSGNLGYNVRISRGVILKNDFRSFGSMPTHLRTFKAWLFKKIKKKDLLYEGDFYKMTGDMSFMLPMLEMAGKHSKFISEVLYIYNDNNPISDHRVDWDLQKKLNKHIRSLPKYRPLN